MDESQFEMAQKLEEAQRQQALANLPRYEGESALECEECGIQIPEARRLAVPGCRLCVDCKAYGEDRR